MKMSPYEKVLHECLECASESQYKPRKDIREWTSIIVGARTKAAVTVTVTSLVKKCVDPAQDIRRHRVRSRAAIPDTSLTPKQSRRS